MTALRAAAAPTDPRDRIIVGLERESDEPGPSGQSGLPGSSRFEHNRFYAAVTLNAAARRFRVMRRPLRIATLDLPGEFLPH